MSRSSHEVIGVIGAGVVGGAVRAYFEGRDDEVAVFDPPKGYTDAAALDRTDVVFVCVPTPYTRGVGFDDGHLLKAVSAIRGDKSVVIKSTVLPGTTDILQERYPRHRFIFNPEFLREASAYDDFVRPDRQVIGCTDASRGDAERLLAMLPRAPFELICTAREAEMAKYVANSFLAVKVMFANEAFDLCEALRIDYGAIRAIVSADERIGGSHMEIFDSGYRGYGGKCLPKDSKALLDLARIAGVDMHVLAAADHANALLRPEEHAEHITSLRAVAAAATDERAA